MANYYQALYGSQGIIHWQRHQVVKDIEASKPADFKIWTKDFGNNGMPKFAVTADNNKKNLDRNDIAAPAPAYDPDDTRTRAIIAKFFRAADDEIGNVAGNVANANTLHYFKLTNDDRLDVLQDNLGRDDNPSSVDRATTENRIADLFGADLYATGDARDDVYTHPVLRFINIQFKTPGVGDAGRNIPGWAETIQFLNPQVAANILRILQFQDVMEPLSNNSQFQIKKVQSVSSWLDEMFSSEIKCTPGVNSGPLCGPLKERLGDDNYKLIKELVRQADNNTQHHNLFNFLDLLVTWVNHHVGVLNPEYNEDPPSTAKKPKRNKAYDMTGYWNDGATLQEFRQSCTSIAQLQNLLKSDMYGRNYNPDDAVKKTIRYTFPNYGANYFRGLFPPGFGMSGGAVQDPESVKKLKEVVGAYGYDLLKSIFDKIQNIKSGSGNKLVSANTIRSMDKHLNDLKKAEDNILKLLAKLVHSSGIYYESGQKANIFPFVENDANFEALLKKYDSLLNKYNKRSSSTVDLMSIIQKSVAEYLAKNQQLDNQFHRPLSAY